MEEVNGFFSNCYEVMEFDRHLLKISKLNVAYYMPLLLCLFS